MLPDDHLVHCDRSSMSVCGEFEEELLCHQMAIVSEVFGAFGDLQQHHCQHVHVLVFFGEVSTGFS